MGLIGKALVRTQDVVVVAVQARRVTCEHCGNHFSFLVTERQDASDSGVRGLSDPERQIAAAAANAVPIIRAWAASSQVDQERCPHCGKLDRWTTWSSSLQGGAIGAMLGFLLYIPALIIGIGIADVEARRQGTSVLPALGAILMSLASLIVMGIVFILVA